MFNDTEGWYNVSKTSPIEDSNTTITAICGYSDGYVQYIYTLTWDNDTTFVSFIIWGVNDFVATNTITLFSLTLLFCSTALPVQTTLYEPCGRSRTESCLVFPWL